MSKRAGRAGLTLRCPGASAARGYTDKCALSSMKKYKAGCIYSKEMRKKKGRRA
jgi:hypothetical protein